MKTLTIFFISLFSGSLLFAQQTKVVTSGTVEYDEVINMYGIGRINLQVDQTVPSKIMIQSLDRYMQNNPQFVTIKNKITFNSNRSIYNSFRPITPIAQFGANPLQNKYNTTYNDYTNGMSVTHRSVQGAEFLVSDSTRKIKWKIIPGVTRDVAGYTCREAHGIIQDSLYVVAFYTDKIWVSGGPESFQGLPGMILEVVLPHEHVSWIATKVTETTISDAAIVPPKGGKPMTNKQLATYLDAVFRSKNIGALAMYQLKMFSI